MAIENSGTQITSDFVKAKLMQDDKYNNEVKGETALYSKVKKNDGRKFKSEIKCYGCGQIGHIKPKCPNKVQHKPKDKHCSTVKGGNKALQTVQVQGKVADTDCSSWFIDSGATSHMTFQHNFQMFESQDELQIVVANNQKLSSNGIGSVKVNTSFGPKTISEVFHVPELRTNLLSVSKMVEKGHSVVFENSGYTVFDSSDFSVKGQVVVTASLKNNLYQLDLEEPANEKVFLTNHYNSQDLWRRRLGHLNHVSMHLLKNGMATGMTYDENKVQPCTVCVMGKQGIEHQLTVRYTPQQNGVAERTNRTIVETARCLIQEAKLNECGRKL